MINSKEAFFSQYVRELPESAYTKSGVLYHPRESRWSFRDGLKKISCNFEAIPELGLPLIHGLKVALIWRFANISAETVVQDFHLAQRLIRSIATHRKSENSGEFKNQPIEKISSHDILNLRSSHKENGPILARVSGLLQKWHGLSFLYAVLSHLCVWRQTASTLHTCFSFSKARFSMGSRSENCADKNQPTLLYRN